MGTYKRENVNPARVDFLFETNRFHLSQVKDNFIHPCCFGKDLAEWLRDRLVESRLSASPPGQEDWGWYVRIRQDSQRYLLGVAGNRKPAAASANDGEWRIMMEKRRSLWEKALGKNMLTDADSILSTIANILREQSDFRDVR
jgi:hypothetical protein